MFGSPALAITGGRVLFRPSAQRPDSAIDILDASPQTLRSLRWRDVAVDQIVADIEASTSGNNPLPQLMLRAFSGRQRLEIAIRSWASHSALVRKALQAVDERRQLFIASWLEEAGFAPDQARARAQILYWAFIGYTLSETAPSRSRQSAILNELIRLASRDG